MTQGILVVDDSSTIRKILSAALECDGYDLTTAADGQEALATAAASCPDVILLDFEMPGMNGLEVLHSLKAREETCGISVIMVSSHGENDKVVEALDAGATDYILKPFSESIVRARVRNVIKTRRYAEALEAGNKALGLLSSIVESSEDAIMAESLSGQITCWNDGATLLFGYTASEVIGKSASLIVPIDLASQRNMLLEKATRGERTDHLYTSRQRKDGSRVDVSLNVSPIKDTGGQVVGTSSIVRDITEHKHAEQELKNYAVAMKQLREEAEDANRAKSEFLSNMSHEIRTPMTAILGFTDILLGNVVKPENVDSARTVKENGEYLLELINDILDLSKIESGKIEMELIASSPHQIITNVASLMSVRAKAKGVTLDVRFDGPVPETVCTDPTRLRQVLINVVGNAIKFTETGSVRIVSRLLNETGEEPKLQFDVIDTGIGIPTDRIAQVFTPFTQVDGSTTRNFGGTGLGLSISRQLVELLGGEFSVQSTVGTGSTFSFTVCTGPLNDVRLLQDAAEAGVEMTEKEGVDDTDVSLCDRRILMAEDGPDNQRLIGFVLKKAGAEVTLADNGQIALELAEVAMSESRPFDVILMDMQMPVLDGYEATRRLRKGGYIQPIIAMTAHAMATDRQKCLDAGCDDYTTKPIDRKKLIELVASYAASGALQASS